MDLLLFSVSLLFGISASWLLYSSVCLGRQWIHVAFTCSVSESPEKYKKLVLLEIRVLRKTGKASL